jgi:hypothetical protein
LELSVSSKIRLFGVFLAVAVAARGLISVAFEENDTVARMQNSGGQYSLLETPGALVHGAHSLLFA